MFDKEIKAIIENIPHLQIRYEERCIKFSVFKLIMYIGTLQSLDLKNSNVLNFIRTYIGLGEYSSIRSAINQQKNFCIKITDIRNVKGIEGLRSYSELLGVGLSVIVSNNLFKIKLSTISKILGKGSRMDWICFLENGKTLFVEAKGTIDSDTRNKQIRHAEKQKQGVTNNSNIVKVISASLLKENDISDVIYKDPDTNFVQKEDINVLRAKHYVGAFVFLGNRKFAKYFKMMQKRLQNNISDSNLNIKENMFVELNDKNPIIDFKNNSFSGFFYNVNKEKYIFLGINKKLLSYKGFIDYKDNETDIEEDINGNKHILYQDGILVIEISNISAFKGIPCFEIDKIKNYYEYITMFKIDKMNDFDFQKYIEYILKDKYKLNIEKKDTFLIVEYNGEKYTILTKISKNIDYIQIKEKYNKKFIFITNAKIVENISEKEKSYIINRDDLKKIIKNTEKILSIFKK